MTIRIVASRIPALLLSDDIYGTNPPSLSGRHGSASLELSLGRGPWPSAFALAVRSRHLQAVSISEQQAELAEVASPEAFAVLSDLSTSIEPTRIREVELAFISLLDGRFIPRRS